MRENPASVTAVARGVICYIGFGSNLGDREARCREGLARLERVEGLTLARVSSLYRTEPVEVVEQPWFLNGAAEIRTRLGPRELLEEFQAIENEMGRREKGTGGPRTIDLDILLYGQEIIHEPDLEIPHGQLHRRRFVLVPLNEIAPWAVHPLFGISVRGLLHRLDDSSVVEKIDSFA